MRRARAGCLDACLVVQLANCLGHPFDQLCQRENSIALQSEGDGRGQQGANRVTESRCLFHGHGELATCEHSEEVGDEILHNGLREARIDERPGGQGSDEDGARSSQAGRRSPGRRSRGPRSACFQAKTFTR